MREKFNNAKLLLTQHKETIKRWLDLTLIGMISYFIGAASMAQAGNFLYQPNKLPFYQHMTAILMIFFLWEKFLEILDNVSGTLENFLFSWLGQLFFWLSIATLSFLVYSGR